MLSMYDPGRFQILGLYNAGNLLNESEMPFDALEKICLLISQNPHIKRISIESKPEYIDAEKLRRISAILQGKEIEIGMGLETLNAKVRDLCINKPYSRRLLEKKVDLMFSLGIIPKAYLLLKPPFLTEKEAIDDFLSSYQQLHQMGIHRIDCETMTIEDHTLVHLLWQKNLYRTPWLWTIIYLLEQLKESKIYFTPFRYIVNSLAIAKNCEQCSQLVKNSIFNYQEGKLSLEELVKLDCSCKADWLADLNKTDERPIEARVIDFLSNIELLNGYSVEPLHTSIPESLEVNPNE